MDQEARLPMVISIPHGGIQIPPEVKSLCRLKLPDILRDGDTWAGHLYDLERRVFACHCFPVARAVADVNRAPDDRAPENPDGVVKSLTVDYNPIWKDPAGLPDRLTELLLQRHYYPYHGYLEAAVRNRHILLGLDCHSMLERAPQLKGRDEPGERRPLVCLSNRGDEKGEALDEPVTAPPELIRSLAGILERRLKDLGYNQEGPLVSLNKPFKGGYIIEKHGSTGRIPWIQVEFNRALYLLSRPRTVLPPQEVLWRINRIRACFLGSLEELFSPGRR